MSKKKNKKSKNKHKNSYFTNSKTITKSYVSSRQIEAIAFKVFGSTYYTPDI